MAPQRCQVAIAAVIRLSASCQRQAGSGEAGRPLFRQVPSASPCPPAQRRATLPGASRKFLQAGSRQSARPATGDHRALRKRPWKPFGSICNSRAWPANRFSSIDELTAVRDCAERGISLTPPLPGGSAGVGPARRGCRDRRGVRAQGLAETEPLSAAARCASAASRATGIDTGCHRPVAERVRGPLRIRTASRRRSWIKSFLRHFRGNRRQMS